MQSDRPNPASWVIPVFFGTALLGGLAGTVLAAVVIAAREETFTAVRLLRDAREMASIGMAVGVFFGAPLALTALGFVPRVRHPATLRGWSVVGFVGGSAPGAAAGLMMATGAIV